MSAPLDLLEASADSDAGEGLSVRLLARLPNTFVVGLGSVQVLEMEVGRDWGGFELYVVRGDTALSAPQIRIEVFPHSDTHRRIFATLAWRSEWVGQSVALRLAAQMRGEMHSVLLGEQTLVGQTTKPLAPVNLPGDEPLLAICMASYEPDLLALQRQIDSIVLQTYQNWLLIIADDGSSPATLHQMHTICQIADPQRIKLIEHKQNLGFYRNFERALSYVPLEAEFVALSDQDDVWYPDKLTRLVQALQESDAELAYSDMRIVEDSGELVSGTYWAGRKNEYRDKTTVFLANTVTGAASVFQRRLLEAVLPFPARVGDAFHDHWLGLVAMQQGRISYVDEPLYDYYQYGRSVIGHCDFTRWSVAARLKSVFGVLARFVRPVQAKRWLAGKIGGGLAIYRGESLRLRLFADTLLLRHQSGKGARRRSTLTDPLHLIGGGISSFLKLMLVHIRILAQGKTTDDAEFRLAMAELARVYERFRMRRS